MKRKKNIRRFCFYSLGLIIFICLILSGCSFLNNTNESSFSLKPGDLLFQELNGSPFFEAVAKVTQGYNGAVITHVGIVAYNDKGEIIVLEALEEGVVTTPIDIFLKRNLDINKNPKVLVGRLKNEYRWMIKSAINEAFARIGKPYNHLFDIEDENSYYCSELVYVCFRNANKGQPLFELQPMTFIDPDTQEIFPVWKDYFSDLKADVPEGKPGINPGGISSSNVIKIIHIYGMLTGLKE